MPLLLTIFQDCFNKSISVISMFFCVTQCLPSEILISNNKISEKYASVLVLKYSDIVLDNLETLTDPVAMELSKTRSKLSLKGLSSITDEQAIVLSKSHAHIYFGLNFKPTLSHLKIFQGKITGVSFGGLKKLRNGDHVALSKYSLLFLDNLDYLPDEFAKSFSKSDSINFISLNSLKLITEKTLATLCSGKYTLSLGGFESISNSQSKILGLFPHDIYLPSLKTISDEQFKLLLMIPKKITFNSLRKLTAMQEEMVFNFSGDIELLGLEEITPRLVKIIIKKNKNALILDKVKLLTDESSCAIGECGNLYISLNGLQTISKKQAKNLSKNTGILCLNGISFLKPDVFYELSNFCGTLELNGLTAINPDISISLSRHIGALKLNGLHTINNDSVKILSNHIGGIELNGLRYATDSQFYYLSRIKSAKLNVYLFLNLWLRNKYDFHKFLFKIFFFNSNLYKIPSDTSLGLSGIESISEKASFYLGASELPLKLDGLKNISCDCLKNLFVRPKWITLNGLSNLNDAQAQTLGEHVGDLELNNIDHLTDSQVLFLSLHKGGLSLKSITQLTNLSSKYFSLNKTYVDLSGVSFLTEIQAANLCKTNGFVQIGNLFNVSDQTKKILEGCSKVSFLSQ